MSAPETCMYRCEVCLSTYTCHGLAVQCISPCSMHSTPDATRATSRSGVQGGVSSALCHIIGVLWTICVQGMVLCPNVQLYICNCTAVSGDNSQPTGVRVAAGAHRNTCRPTSMHRFSTVHGFCNGLIKGFWNTMARATSVVLKQGDDLRITREQMDYVRQKAKELRGTSCYTADLPDILKCAILALDNTNHIHMIARNPKNEVFV